MLNGEVLKTVEGEAKFIGNNGTAGLDINYTSSTDGKAEQEVRQEPARVSGRPRYPLSGRGGEEGLHE